MNNLLIIVFDDATQAPQGNRVLKELLAQHEITVYSASSVARARNGSIEICDLKHYNSFDTARNPLAFGAVGLLCGLLGAPFGVGLFTATAGALAGAWGGGFMELMLEFVKTGGREQLADEVSQYLQLHMVALLADVEEGQTSLIDSRMKEVGGNVFRQPRTAAGYLLVERELVSLGRELTALREEESTAKGEAKVEALSELEALRGKLQDKIERAETLEDATQRVAEFKSKALELQIAAVVGARQHDLRQSLSGVRADYKKRCRDLVNARQTAQRALAA